MHQLRDRDGFSISQLVFLGYLPGLAHQQPVRLGRVKSGRGGRGEIREGRRG